MVHRHFLLFFAMHGSTPRPLPIQSRLRSQQKKSITFAFAFLSFLSFQFAINTLSYGNICEFLIITPLLQWLHDKQQQQQRASYETVARRRFWTNGSSPSP